MSTPRETLVSGKAQTYDLLGGGLSWAGADSKKVMKKQLHADRESQTSILKATQTTRCFEDQFR